MTIIRRMCILFAILVVSPSLWATETSAVIAGIESRYQAITSLQAAFTQSTYIATLDKTIANTGTLRLKKPGRFRIDYTGSFPKQYISNGKTIWIYIPGDKQVDVYRLNKKTVSREVLEFLNGFSNLRRDFTIVDVSEKSPPTQYRVLLKPKSTQTPYSQLECLFDASFLMTAVTIHNPNGGSSHYDFTSIESNPDLSENLFLFSEPGVEEIH